MRRFTEDHVWLLLCEERATVGITAVARERLGDVVLVELPEKGAELSKDDVVAVIESVKVAFEIAMPLDGTILEVNHRVLERPDLVNEAPEGDGWLFAMSPTNPNDIETLMDAIAYAKAST